MNSETKHRDSTVCAVKDIQLEEVLILDEIQRMQDIFSDTTGVTSMITKTDGTPITNPSNFCDFCNLVRSTEKGLKNCLESHDIIAKTESTTQDLHITPCKCVGLLNASANILVDGNVVANWQIGQVRNGKINEQRLVDYATEIGVESADLLKAMKSVPVMTNARFMKVTEMLLLFTNQLSEKADSKFLSNMLQSKKQKLLWEEERLLFLHGNMVLFRLEDKEKKPIDCVTPNLVHLLGYTPQEIESLQLKFSDLINPEDLEQVISETNQNIALNKKHFDLKPYRLIHKNGESRWVSEFTKVYSNEPGGIKNFISYIVDITDKKKSDFILEQITENYETFFNTINDFLFVLDEQGNIIHTNSTVTTRLGYTSEELYQQSVLMVHPPERREEAGKIVGEMLNGTAESCPVPIETKSGLQIPVETKIAKGNWNGIPAIFGVTKDISALKLSEERFSKVFNINPSACGLSDLVTQQYVEVNEAFCTLFGFDKDEVIGKTAVELGLFTSEERHITETKLNENGAAVNIEAQLKTKNGNIKYVLLSAENIYVQDKQYRFTIAQDITESKLATDALLVEKRRLADIIRGTNAGCWEWHVFSGETIFNERWAEIIGYTLDEISPTSFETWLNLTHPDDLKPMYQALEKHLNGESEFYTCEVRMKHKNGDWVWIYSSGRICERNEEGIPMLISGIHLDITERKKAEDALTESQDQLKKFAAHLQNAREEERVLLATEIHDELGQILVALKMDIGMLKQKVQTGVINTSSEDIFSKFDQLYNLVGNSIKTTLKIMTDLRSEVLYLLGFVEATRIYSIEFEEKYKIKCTFECTITKLEIDSQKSVILFRILQDAMTNTAQHALATEVKINMYNLDDKLILEITDNGIGFDQKLKVKSNTYGIIGMKERAFLLNGAFKITSQPNCGTCIKIEIPFST